MWPRNTWQNPPRVSATIMREVATSRLVGSGIEFGAAGNPMPAPLHCQVEFADSFPEEDQRSRAYPGQGSEFVRISHLMSMDDMGAVPEASLDFAITCHVIEHTRNPLGAFEQVYRKLKRGGQYVLVVPDKKLTFDKDRDPTTLDHLILDYQEPSAERDVPHYTEFFRIVRLVPEAVLDQCVRDAIASRQDIHFHTWTYESFQAMVDHSRRHMTPWRSVWSQPAVEADPEAIEFYFVLEK
jgi:SAM-dependent methyltransferase